MDISSLKIAIVCDWLKDWGGAEQVLYDILEVFPHADIYSSIFFPEKFPELRGRVQTTFLQNIPFLSNRPKMIPFLRTYAFESLDLTGYDIVISSSSAESKGILTRAETLHICYCHTPTRYYWSHAQEYARNPEFGWLNPLARLLIPFFFHRLRMWDFQAAQRVDIFLANSETTAARIQKYYRRTSSIINPGLDDTQFTLRSDKSDYFMALGRIIPYKRFDLLVETFNQNGLPLKIVTFQQNRLQEQLRAKSKPNIEWILQTSHAEKVELYQ